MATTAVIEESPVVLVYAVAGAVLAWCAVWALEWAWWRPRRLDRALRSQGLRGTTYRSLAGDVPLLEQLNREARSRTMPLGCHDVVPRAMPLFHHAMKERGKTSITWFGRMPRVTITEPELVRQVLSNKFFPTKTNRRMRHIASEIERILRGIITKRENALKAGKATSDDLLGVLLESNMAHWKGDGNADAGITTDDVIGECKLFYFAGMETTSVLLTWTMILLCMHPDWQDRAREEIIHVLGATTATPDYDSLSRLKIVTMVLYEVMRLYTPLTSLQRKTCKPTELGGVRYPAGVLLLLPLLSIHHDKEVWGADADEFRPERFAEGISKASADAPAFFPFGWGPRICVGQNFALLEAKMGLAIILQRFSFEHSPSYTHAPFTVGLLQPEHGAQVRLRRLQ